MSHIEDTRADALAKLEGVADATALNTWRLEFLGKKGVVQGLMKKLREIPNEEKRAFGQGVNDLKQELTDKLEAKKSEFGDAPVVTGPMTDIIHALTGSIWP